MRRSSATWMSNFTLGSLIPCSAVPPPQKPPSTFLPLLGINTLYLNRTGEPNQQKPDDYLVDIRHIGDTADTDKGDPTGGRSVYDANSELWVYVFHATAESSLDWYWGIWKRTDYPDHDTKRSSGVQPTIQVYGYRLDVATLTDEQTISTQMSHLKERVKTHLG
jgi:hypothetical protein